MAHDIKDDVVKVLYDLKRETYFGENVKKVLKDLPCDEYVTVVNFVNKCREQRAESERNSWIEHIQFKHTNEEITDCLSMWSNNKKITLTDIWNEGTCREFEEQLDSEAFIRKEA